MCGKFYVFTHQSIRDVEIFTLSNSQDFKFCYISYIEKIYSCVDMYTCRFGKSKISENFHLEKYSTLTVYKGPLLVCSIC